MRARQGYSIRISPALTVLSVIVSGACPGVRAAADPSPEKRAQELFEQGKQSFSAAQYTRAAGELIESLRLNPRQPRAAKALGVCYQVLGDLKRAGASFSASVELDGNDAETWFFLGRVHYLQYSFDKAQEALETSARLDPGDPQVHELLGMTLETTGETERALGEFAEAVRCNTRLRKPRSTPHLSYGVFLHKLNRLEESETQLRLAVRIDPKDWLGHFELGKLLLDLDRFEAAVQELTAASRSLKPGAEDYARVYRLLGRAYYRMGRDDDARAALLKAGR